MKYKSVIRATFISRPNRFIATVDISGSVETVHVKNTGRCKELLIPGATVYLEKSDNPQRKTRYDLIAVVKNEDLLINIDSQVPNTAFYEYLLKSGSFSENAVIRREITYSKSRFDIYVEDGSRRCFIEVKGVTLENNGVAMFPDAPTLRGVKHVNELISAKNNGYECYIAFVIQMKGIRYFTPNVITDEPFSKALKRACESGVNVIAYDCIITPDSITVDKKIPVVL